MSWPVAAVVMVLLFCSVAVVYMLTLKEQRKGWAALEKSNADNTLELKKTMAAVLKLNARVDRHDRVLDIDIKRAVASGELEAD